MLDVGKQVRRVGLACDEDECPESAQIYTSDVADWLRARRAHGWKIVKHRKGDPTVICPECIDKRAAAKQEKADAKEAVRKEIAQAKAKYKALTEKEA